MPVEKEGILWALKHLHKDLYYLLAFLRCLNVHALYGYMSRWTVMANVGSKGPARLAGKLRIWPTGSKAQRHIKSWQVRGSGQGIVRNSMAPRLGDLGLTARHSAKSRKPSLATPLPCMINNLSKLENVH